MREPLDNVRYKKVPDISTRPELLDLACLHGFVDD